MKIEKKESVYQTPVIREFNCIVECGFAISETTDFDDLDYEGRPEF